MRISPPTISLNNSGSTEENARSPAHSNDNDDEYPCLFPTTPGGKDYDFSHLDDIGMSPATPFFLSQRSKLVQQTCPPKQTRQGLFGDYSSREEGSPDGLLSSERLRLKLEAARRKSLVYKPKIGSPLAL